MDLKKRIAAVVIIYFVLLTLGYFATHSIDKELKTERFSYDSLVVRTFMDDFVRVWFSFEGKENTSEQVNFVILDQYNNLWHNTTIDLIPSKYYQIDLQPVPRDFEHGREYIVYANFLNHSVNSGYFGFQNLSKNKLVVMEGKSWLSFMILENHLALGTYCDQQRMIWLSTNDPSYGKNYLACQTVEISFLLMIVLTVDGVLWILYWIYIFYKNKTLKLSKKKKNSLK